MLQSAAVAIQFRGRHVLRGYAMGIPHTAASFKGETAIAVDIVHRIYGDALAIVINVKTRQVALLRDEALAVWASLAEGRRAWPASDPGHAVLERLAALGMIETVVPAPAGSVVRGQGLSPDAVSAEMDIAAVTYWAFKNHIPLIGHFEFTGRCNLRCRHCYCVFDRKQDSLSTSQIATILDDLRANGTLGLVITGGEFFVRKDALDILALLQQKNFLVRLNTNGTFITPEIAEALARMGNVYRVHVSLYGPTAAVHDRVTTVRGSFARTLRAIKLMKEAGVDLRLNCSIMRSNFDHWHALKETVADPLGIPVRFDPIIFSRDDGGTANLNERLDDAQFQRADARLSALAADATESKQPRSRPKLCKAAFSFFCITENGDVYPCLKMKKNYSKPMGNIVTQRFDDIWHASPVEEQIRAPLRHKLRHCSVCDLTV